MNPVTAVMAVLSAKQMLDNVRDNPQSRITSLAGLFNKSNNKQEKK